MTTELSDTWINKSQIQRDINNNPIEAQLKCHWQYGKQKLPQAELADVSKNMSNILQHQEQKTKELYNDSHKNEKQFTSEQI